MRGLKESPLNEVDARLVSHPAWDAWIESFKPRQIQAAMEESHPAWDAWIERLAWLRSSRPWVSRIPHGMRGLKDWIDL